MGRRKKSLKKAFSKKPKRDYYLDPAMQQYMDETGGDVGVHFPEALKRGKKLLGAGNGTHSETNYGGQFFQHSGYKSCTHEGKEIVYEYNGKKIYASSWNGLKEYSGDWELIIDLAGNVRPSPGASPFIKKISSERFNSLLGHTIQAETRVIPSEVLALDWNDMGIPPVTYDFWVELWRMMPATTVVACMGGHGRTGTCIAALMIVSGLDYWTTLETVRKQHCDKAVESLKQEQYLHALYIEDLERQLIGLDVNSEEAKDIIVDIEYAKDNVPSNTANTATKSYGLTVPKTKRWKVLANEFDIQSKELAGVTYVKECVDVKCSTYKCDLIDHLGWIPKDESLYANWVEEGMY